MFIRSTLSVFLQVKCTSQPITRQRSFTIKPAWRKNWEDLGLPGYFVVVSVPADTTDWVEHSGKPWATELRSAAFWTRIDPLKPDQKSITVVKSSCGVRHHPRELLVAGGPVEVSVQVTFREPDRSDHTALLPEAPETAEGQALVFMAGVFAAAEAATEKQTPTVCALTSLRSTHERDRASPVWQRLCSTAVGS